MLYETYQIEICLQRDLHSSGLFVTQKNIKTVDFIYHLITPRLYYCGRQSQRILLFISSISLTSLHVTT
jgi:hypothetical protein